VTGTRSFADVLDVSPAVSSARDKSDMPQPRGPLRLQLAPSFGWGALDGAWWPYSRDLRTEALDLVNHFPRSAGKSAANILAESDDPLRTGFLEHWEDDGGPSAPRSRHPVHAKSLLNRDSR
jgi:hypothetical protein